MYVHVYVCMCVCMLCTGVCVYFMYVCGFARLCRYVAYIWRFMLCVYVRSVWYVCVQVCKYVCYVMFCMYVMYVYAFMSVMCVCMCGCMYVCMYDDVDVHSDDDVCKYDDD